MNGAQGGTCVGAQGVNTVFGYPGGAIMPVYDAFIMRRGALAGLDMSRVRQWRAIGHARATGKTGDVSPRWSGATNLITWACGRTVRSYPVVAITGQVSRTVYRH
ncbi:thiamine pyrophosphate-binding protein [Escherichia coli]